jgi:superfamily II DNA/RNA helicase
MDNILCSHSPVTLKFEKAMDFKEFISHPKILQSLAEQGLTIPTPIQAQAIPKINQGADVRASAQTGTGKTAAYLLPALSRLADADTSGNKKTLKGPKVLILVPTRELAMQVAKEAAKFSKHMPYITTVCIYGGAPYPIQNRDLSRPYEILVATPGRLMDHMERGRISLARLELLILDEADRMLDMGFVGPVEEIAAATPASRQTLLFSATFNKNVIRLSERLLKNPIEIAIKADNIQADNIEQRMHHVDDLQHKYKLLDHFLLDEALVQTIVFTATKRQADQLTDCLLDKGHEAAALHGDMNQRQRERTIEKLRRGGYRILVATDVAARGIDIKSISHVINFDMPNNAEDYVHRIGRTGRAGKSGIALSLVSPKDRHLIREIEQFIGLKVNSVVIPGMEPRAREAFPKRSPSAPFRRKSSGFRRR